MGAVEEGAGRRLILFAGAIVVGLWFLHAVLSIVVFFVAAFILAIAFDPPVEAMVARGAPRWLAVLAVLAAVVVAIVAFAVVVVPPLADQVLALIDAVPTYIGAIDRRLDDLLAAYPDVADSVALDGEAVRQALPGIGELLSRVGAISLSAVGLLVFIVVLVTVVVFSLLEPLPLARTYLRLFPERHQAAAARAFAAGRTGVVGWVRANVIVGILEAVAVFVVLSLLGVPAVLVWAGLALFAELVPKVGAYIMSIPPIIVAVATDPLLGLAVLVFYVVLAEVAGSVVAPLVRSNEMRLHAVFLLFVFMAMAAAFGILGALISTPFAAFVAAFYREFWVRQRRADDELDPVARRMLAMPAAKGDG